MTIEEAICRNKASGSNWFTPRTMKFWNSKVESPLIDEKYFITSEDNCDRTETLYSIRAFTPDYSDVETVGDFQAYKTKSNAKTALDVIRRVDEMRDKAGFRENEILDDITKVVPFVAPRPHECYAIFSGSKECIYDFYEGRFVG